VLHKSTPVESPSVAPRSRRDDTALLGLAELWSNPSHLAAIEACMRRLCVAGRDPALGELAWEHVSAGGKRLRARQALFAVSALGGQLEQGIAWGACCELLHNASLIHDDVQDGDRLRRRRPSLWARHGVAQAINPRGLGIPPSYLAIGVIPVSDAVRWQLTRTVSTAARTVVEGQAAELGLLAAPTLTWDAYAACVEGKTAALFGLPLEGAAVIAGRAADEAIALGAAFRPLGLLFQIQDDILDLFGDNGREARGSDLAQTGKVTAFVVEHLRLHPGDGPWLRAILTTPRGETSADAIGAVIARFASGGALAAVWRRIDEMRAAVAQARILDGEPALRALVDRFVAEALRPVAHTRPGAC